MGKIHILDEHVANLIAAGEVVERPANIVKECVENSIDAQATQISIEVWEGGIDKLIITDDGKGMSKEDASLAFMRHATSKMKDEEDLFNIHTMGFRGEALPSIAAVAKVEMQTNDEKESTLIEYEYGEKVGEEHSSFPRGTRIEITGLFYKTPARFKYLRKASYEFSVIADLVNKFALSHPTIRFHLFHNERLVFQTSGNGNLQEIIYQMYGKEVAENAEAFSNEDETFKISGFAVQPKINRASKYFIFLSINGRLIRSRAIQNAIIETYHNYMPPNRFPIFFMDLEVDPQLIDINVHPNKWEVKILKQNELLELIKKTIIHLFSRELKTVQIKAEETNAADHKPYQMKSNDFFQMEQEPLKIQEEPLFVEPSFDWIDHQIEKLKEEVAQIPVYENIYDQTFESIDISPKAEQSYENPMIQEESKAQEIEKKAETRGQEFFKHLRVIGQLHASYILCENQEGLVIIDQHAAQERFHYEQLQKELLNPSTKTQPLMVPIQIHASSDVMSHLDSINEKVQPFSIHFESFGLDRILVREVPIWLKDVDEQPFFESLIALFMENLNIDLAQIRKHVIATMACHSSIRFNRTLSLEEMKQVINDLQKCQQPYHCPHGRPTVITIDDSELRKEFERG